jgi:hypothetical protein
MKPVYVWVMRFIKKEGIDVEGCKPAAFRSEKSARKYARKWLSVMGNHWACSITKAKLHEDGR